MTETQQQQNNLLGIHERFGNGVVAALNGLEESIAEVDKKPSSHYTKVLPGYVDDIDDGLRSQLIAQAREQERQQVKDESKEILEGAIEHYQEQMQERRNQVNRELREMADGSGELFRLAVATDEELHKFSDAVSDLGSEKHAAALVLVAQQRGLHHIPQQLAATLGGLFDEVVNGPSPEHVERTAKDQRRIIAERLG